MIKQKAVMMANFIIRISFLFAALAISLTAYAQDASILPPAKTSFFDANGNPLSSGTVTFYVPNTTTKKTTWQDASKGVANQNPLSLDSAGRALIWGFGSYRQIVKDKAGNTIWDQVTSSAGSGSVTPSTGDGDLVGTIKPWAGLVAPNQYAFAYGQEISRTTYATLFTAITLTANVTCANGSPILTNLADATQIPVGAAVEVSCLSPGATVISKTTTTITVSSNAISTTTASSIIFPYGNGNGSSTFNLPDLRGRVVAGRDNMGGTAASRLTSTYFGETADALGANGGTENIVLATKNLPAYTPSGTIVNDSHNHIMFNNSNSNAGAPLTTEYASGVRSIAVVQDYAIQKSATGIAPDSGKTSSTTVTATFTGVAQGGTSTAFATIQPTLTLNYIIKITSDTNSSEATGVLSLGGMTGVIACGSGLICTGNIVSLASFAANPWQTVTSSTTLNYNMVLCDATSGNILLTLPVPSSYVGLPFWIKRKDSSSNTCNITGVAIDGGTLLTLNIQYQVHALQADGAQWWVMQ